MRINNAKRITETESCHMHDEIEIIVDIEALEYVVYDVNLLDICESLTEMITELAEGSPVTATAKRKVILNVNEDCIILKNVYYILSLRLSLISCSRFDKKDMTTSIAKSLCTMYDRHNQNAVLGRVRKWNSDSLHVPPVELLGHRKSGRFTLL